MVSTPSVLALGLVLLTQHSAALANTTKTACPGFGNDTLVTPSPTPCATIMVLPTPSPTPCATTSSSPSNSSAPSPTPASTSVDSGSNSTAPSPTPAATNANTYSNITAPCPTPSTTTMAPSTPCPTAQDSSSSEAATVAPGGDDVSDTGLGSSFNASAPSPSARAQVTSSSSSSSCPPYTVTLFSADDFSGQSGTVAAIVQTCYNSVCIVPSQSPGSLEWFKPSTNSSDCYDAPKISIYADQDCEGDALDTYSSSDDFPSELSGVASFMVWETSDVPTTLTDKCAQK